MTTISKAKKMVNFTRNSSQKMMPASSPYDAANAASIIRAMNSDSMLEPTLSMTLESRCSP